MCAICVATLGALRGTASAKPPQCARATDLRGEVHPGFDGLDIHEDRA